jgi:hypothetical protein
MDADSVEFVDSTRIAGLHRRWAAPYVALTLILGVAATFVVVRSQTTLVFDDTPGLAVLLYDQGNPPGPNGVQFYTQIVKDSFGDQGSSAYRPLSALISHFASEVFRGRFLNMLTWYCLVGLIHGATVCSVFFVARRFVADVRWAYLAAFLFAFSAPNITAAWVVGAGIQAIVTLVVCSGLLLYWRVAERRNHYRWAAAGLCVLMLFGPWFREFIGILTVLVMFEELRRNRRPTWLMGVAGLCLLHALFPTTLIKYAFSVDLPLRSIFGMGSLAETLDAPIVWQGDLVGWLRAQFNAVRWLAGWHFIVLLPPSLLILVVVSFFVESIRDLTRSIPSHLNRNAHSAKLGKASLKAAVLPLLYAALLIGLKCFKGDWHTIGVFLCLGLAVVALKQSAFLAVWFLLAFLPFLKVYTEPVHLAYAMVPASIVVAAAVEKLWNLTSGVRRPVRAARFAMAAILVTTIGDHALTLYGSYRVVTGSYNGIMRVADWFRENTPSGSVVIGNAVHTADVRLFSKGHLTAYRTAGPSSDPQIVMTPRQLETLLAKNFDQHDVYLLDMDYEFPSNKSWYHSHRFVENKGIAKKDLGKIHVTRVRYPFLDPLRNLIEQPYITFLGPPDLENDFFHGRARNRRFQHYESRVEYHVYKVTSKQVRDYWYPRLPPSIAREGFHGFTILNCNSRYFAIPQRRAEFDVRKILRGQRADCFVSDDLNEVSRRVEEYTHTGNGSLPSAKQSAN